MGRQPTGKRMACRMFAPAAAAVAFFLCCAAVPSQARRSGIPAFTHVVVVVFENRERDAVVQSAEASTFARLGRRYATLTHYDAVAHPSLPNYLALVSGGTHGIADDCTTCVVAASSLADTLANAGRTWKTYAEGLPAAGYTGASAGRYAKKHDPFLYFRNVLARPAWRRRVVPFRQFAEDVRRHRLPDFSLVVPDLCDDMHDCSVGVGDRWLRRRIAPVLSSAALRGGVVFVVFDEGTSDRGGGGNVEALALGPLVRPHARDDAPLDHYSLLRTIEEGWNLPRLGRSGDAPPILGIWR